MKQFNALIGNTTSLVGYIAVLMFVGAYLGGDQSFALDPAVLKGNLMESRDAPWRVSQSAMNHVTLKPIIITIDGRQYEATIRSEVNKRPEFTY